MSEHPSSMDNTPEAAAAPAGADTGASALPRRDHAAWLQGLTAEPWRFDFYQTLRHFEATHPHLPRLGEALKPADEPLRVGQPADLSFAAAPLHSVRTGVDGQPWVMQRIFGFLGPNGPLPTHLTELASERARHHSDPALQRFLDILTHRFALLFYRAWAQAQPTVSLDRPNQDRFADYVGSLVGIGGPTWRQRDAAPDHIKLYFAGQLSRQVRNAEGLESLLSGYLRQRVRIETFVGHWMTLPVSERTRMERGGGISSQLGSGAVLGGKVWDRQHKFRIHIGPLSLAQYEAFLPDGPAMAGVTALVRQYFSMELDWDVRLHLRSTDVPATRPGLNGRLGWTSWVGQRRQAGHADSLTLHPESWRRPSKGPRAAA